MSPENLIANLIAVMLVAFAGVGVYTAACLACGIFFGLWRGEPRELALARVPRSIKLLFRICVAVYVAGLAIMAVIAIVINI